MDQSCAEGGGLRLVSHLLVDAEGLLVLLQQAVQPGHLQPALQLHISVYLSSRVVHLVARCRAVIAEVVVGGHAEVVQHRAVVARLDVPRVDERDRLVVLGWDPELAQLHIQLSRLKRKTPLLFQTKSI